ncbi:hypothetical protein Q3O59_09025 [Alkalimonas delamerensis]|uniref:Uncharacterized protein n=1 Tax=Alkalimonas delamerensis TaxID=265981 RepID=A0ABT9GQE2_9GAMM|nr:hypothetical protein [Alkalimonas delamerensis]MDP4529171.1 hypothetical protein [Alkalimonas delamerensis]
MTESPTKSPKAQETHESLRKAVQDALARKRMLGQYSVQWRANRVVLEGGDAPATMSNEVGAV